MFNKAQDKQNQDQLHFNKINKQGKVKFRQRGSSQISSYQFRKTVFNSNHYNVNNNNNKDKDKTAHFQDAIHFKGKTISNQSTQYQIFNEEPVKNIQTLRLNHNDLEFDNQKINNPNNRYRSHNGKNQKSPKNRNPQKIFPSLKIQDVYNKTSYKSNEKKHLKSPEYKKQKQSYWNKRNKEDPESDSLKVQYFTYSQQGQTLHYNVQSKHNQIVDKQNQDLSFFHNIALKPAYSVRKMHLHFMGLMDGHGKQGLKVVNFLQKQILEYLQFAYCPNNIQHSLSNYQNRQLIQKVILESNQQLICLNKLANKILSDQVSQLQVKALIINLSLQKQKILHQIYINQFQVFDNSIDTNFSGATLNFLCIYNGQLSCFNVGDSRAYLISKKENWTWKMISNLHDLQNQIERNRVLQSGGVIKKINNKDGKEIGPERIWLKTQDNKLLYPGLTMTRSLGDKVGSKIGVIPTPQVTHLKIQKSDKYILMGSDGLFKYFTDNQIIKMLIPYITQKKIQQGLQKIISIIKRLSNRVGVTYDDITINVIRIIHQGGTKQKQKN